MDGDHTIEFLLETEFREAYPDLSPDGRWIAYESDESGQSEIYVRSLVGSLIREALGTPRNKGKLQLQHGQARPLQ